MFEHKPLTREGIERALGKVERYRLLNEPWQAESICRDILAVDPENQPALISLVLSLTDQLKERGGSAADEARSLLQRIANPYQQSYYAGIICERSGTAVLRRDVPGTGPMVYQALVQAMEHYEEAETLRPPGNDDAILRWNTCARLIELHEHVEPVSEPWQHTLLE